MDVAYMAFFINFAIKRLFETGLSLKISLFFLLFCEPLFVYVRIKQISPYIKVYKYVTDGRRIRLRGTARI